MSNSMLQVFDKDLKRQLKSIEKTQYPFVLAKSLTIAAKRGQTAARRRTERVFNLNNKFVTNNIKIIPARKNDIRTFGKADAAVYTDKKIVPFMVQHERGATRAPIKKQNIAVPGRHLPKLARGAGGKIKKNWKPSELLKGKKPNRYAKGNSKYKRGGVNKAFVIQTKSGAAIVRRFGKDPQKLEFLYYLVPNVKIRRTWGFEKIIKLTASKRFPRIFKREMERAIRSIR